jgi:hypothetical protein
MGYYGKLVEDGDLADGVFVVEGGRFPLHRNGAGAERVISGSLQVEDAGRGLEGGMLRESECPCVPGDAAVPLRGRAAGVGGRGRGARRQVGGRVGEAVGRGKVGRGKVRGGGARAV